MSEAPENLVLELLRKMRTEMADMDRKIDSLRADVASDFVLTNAKIDAVRKENSEQIVGLRRAVVEYHSSVVGHGMLISELDARMHRVETHLGLPAMETL